MNATPTLPSSTSTGKDALQATQVAQAHPAPAPDTNPWAAAGDGPAAVAPFNAPGDSATGTPPPPHPMR
ncbi:proline/glycine betaine ABC transporter permease ProW, partial [Acidovorax cattleyae]|nr:proline/glycine betaine ABC transporter permease ProW [Paracidovorax cattleyae]